MDYTARTIAVQSPRNAWSTSHSRRTPVTVFAASPSNFRLTLAVLFNFMFC